MRIRGELHCEIVSPAGVIKRAWTQPNAFTGQNWAARRWRGEGTPMGTDTKIEFRASSTVRQTSTVTSNWRGSTISQSASYTFGSSVDNLRLLTGTTELATAAITVPTSAGDTLNVTWSLNFAYRDNTAGGIDTSSIATVKLTSGGADQRASYFNVSNTAVANGWARMCRYASYFGAPDDYSTVRVELFQPTGTPPPQPDSTHKVDLLLYETLTDTTPTASGSSLSWSFDATWTASQSGAHRYRYWLAWAAESNTGTFVRIANGTWDANLPRGAHTETVTMGLGVA